MKRSALNAIQRVISLTGVVMLGAAGPVRAAAAVAAAANTPFASPVHEALPSTAGGLVRVTLALVFVVAAIFTAAWLSRRMRSAGGARSSSLELLAQLPLGPRERAVLIRVGASQLLVGVANGCIRTLHVLEPTAAASASGAHPAVAAAAGAAAEDAPQRPSFKALLRKSLGK